MIRHIISSPDSQEATTIKFTEICVNTVHVVMLVYKVTGYRAQNLRQKSVNIDVVFQAEFRYSVEDQTVVSFL